LIKGASRDIGATTDRATPRWPHFSRLLLTFDVRQLDPFDRER
jgi:hypothetical protein